MMTRILYIPAAGTPDTKIRVMVNPTGVYGVSWRWVQFGRNEISVEVVAQ